MECLNFPFAARCSVNADTTSRGEWVYYRGRFRADVAWTKVHRAAVAQALSVADARRGNGVVAVRPCRNNQ